MKGWWNPRFPPVEWEEFKEVFLEQVFPPSDRFVKAQEFETLGQGPMSVQEYDTQFYQLAQFGLHILPDGRKDIGRFLRGLRSKLY